LHALCEPTRVDRIRLLDEANRLRASGRHRRAISIYRQVQAQDPEDEEIAFKLAELLAATGQSFEAWQLFRRVGKALLRARRHSQCLATFREATRCLPFEFEAWRITAELELKLGRHEDAHLTLLEARRQFRSRFDHAQAIELLRMARKIEPWDHEVVMDLARLYAQNGQARQALLLLERLAVHSEGRQLRAVRYAQWQISHAFRHFRLWLRAVLSDFGLVPSDPPSEHDSAATLRVRW
jgi:Flp pilus assembly protein TadD